MKPFYGLPRPETNWFWDLRRPRPCAQRRVGAKTNIAGEIVPGWSSGRGRLHVELNCVVHRARCPHSLPHRYNFTSRCYLIREESTSQVKSSSYEDEYSGGRTSETAAIDFSNCTLRKMSFSECFDKRELLLGYLQISPPSSPKHFDIRSNFSTTYKPSPTTDNSF